MKICNKCGKLLDDRAFSKEGHLPGRLSNICKLCQSRRSPSKTITEKSKVFQDDLFFKCLGGYKIFILNHVKENEFRYNIISTDGKSFGTQDKEVFLSFLNNILKQF